MKFALLSQRRRRGDDHGCRPTPAGTMAAICVAEFTAKLGALTPPNKTAVAPVKLLPVIVTTVPTEPLVGEKLATVGAGVGVTWTVKIREKVLVPPLAVLPLSVTVTVITAVQTHFPQGYKSKCPWNSDWCR